MPSGRYSLHDLHDDIRIGEERFSCAPGPAGWRYTSQTFGTDGALTGAVDLTLDSSGRPLRLQLSAGDWQIRGGALDGLVWVRSDATDPEGRNASEGHERAHTFTGRSPAFLIAAARLLRLRPGGTARLRLVALTEPVLAPRTLDQGWSLERMESHATDNGPLMVERYSIADLETGEQRVVHLAGDVVLDAPGVELEELGAPPNQGWWETGEE